MSITLLPEKFNVSELLSIYNSIDLTSREIYVTSFDGKTYSYEWAETQKYAAAGKAYLLNDMVVFNEYFKNSYLEDVYNQLRNKYDVRRCRFMKLSPKIRAYSYHQDKSARLHIPLVTDENCIFLIEDIVYRLSEVGRLYETNTLKKHTAVNLGWNDRIHLVFDKRI